MLASASIWGDNAAKRASLGEYDRARNYRSELNPPDSIMGSPGTTLSYAGYTAWPANLIPEEYRQVQQSTVETLLVSGSIDLNTPAEFAADVLMPSLSNGQHVVLSEFGHAEMVSHQPEATERLLTSFYETGVADDSLFTYHSVDFSAGLGYPARAKLGLAAIALLAVGVTALVWALTRRIRRSRSGQVSSRD
jgi:hypothetical protein